VCTRTSRCVVALGQRVIERKREREGERERERERVSERGAHRPIGSFARFGPTLRSRARANMAVRGLGGKGLLLLLLGLSPILLGCALGQVRVEGSPDYPRSQLSSDDSRLLIQSALDFLNESSPTSHSYKDGSLISVQKLVKTRSLPLPLPLTPPPPTHTRRSARCNRRIVPPPPPPPPPPPQTHLRRA
jgi:hypothetical protein